MVLQTIGPIAHGTYNQASYHQSNQINNHTQFHSNPLYASGEIGRRKNILAEHLKQAVLLKGKTQDLETSTFKFKEEGYLIVLLI